MQEFNVGHRHAYFLLPDITACPPLKPTTPEICITIDATLDISSTSRLVMALTPTALLASILENGPSCPADLDAYVRCCHCSNLALSSSLSMCKKIFDTNFSYLVAVFACKCSLPALLVSSKLV